VIPRTDDFVGHYAGKPLAGMVPDQHIALGVEHEGRHDHVLHQANGKDMRTTFSALHPEALLSFWV
jgi:hypothetical protein